ncbi:TBC1 domain family member 24-like [Brachyhypopomus gauderio]|uniref:TBC1 domain family member 24-like n=1 Tax=Brachyhypopomus gauderio TaxID=698409 RepID=UPI00404130BC
MLQVSSSAEFTSFDHVDLENETSVDTSSHMDCGKLRSCSLYCPEGTGEIKSSSQFLRPRSRSFYMFETDDCSEEDASAETLCLIQTNPGGADGEGRIRAKAKPAPRRITTSPSKRLSKVQADNRTSPKCVPMLTISEPDSWEISSCSGMKYGQYVDWEKTDPDSALRYQNILSSDHAELKEMGRSGFWAKPHTLRAKAYQHIIQCIGQHSSMADQKSYLDLTGQLFGEHRTTHPFPKFMEYGEIPQYCLNKSGLNSVKKILLCVNQHLPELTFCPILPALVSLLLHYSEDEAQCFHSISSLVSYTDPEKRYIDQTFLTTHASCMTFGDLANKYCRGIRKLIASSHQSLFEFYSDWIMWIFADLPFNYAIRVLDVYLIEGYKVLYRVALALLSLYKVSVSSRLARVDDFRQDMRRFVENISRHSSVDALLQRAFSIQLPTRQELTFLYKANMQALMQNGILNKSSYHSMEPGKFCSNVVSKTEMRVVWAWIPERFALFSPVCLFSTTKHGGSLAAFYPQVEGHEPTVLLLKTVDEEVCGAFLSSDWTLRRREGQKLQFFGTEECFVFTLRPSMERYQRTVLHISGISGTCETSQESSCLSPSYSSSCGMRRDICSSHLVFHPPTAKFMSGDDNMLFIGGDGGHALSLFSDLASGQSEWCGTFESPVLCRGQFRVQSLEVWGIQQFLSQQQIQP